MRSSSDIEQAMAAYGDAVWRACVLHLPASEAEDVFQETYLKYALHDGPFNDADHAKAWLLRVAINGCKDVLKSSRRAVDSLDAHVERCGDAALGVSAGADARGVAEVFEAMDALGDPPKTQLYLFLYEGYTAAEISRMCDMPEGTVYSWISRGRRRLKEVLR